MLGRRLGVLFVVLAAMVFAGAVLQQVGGVRKGLPFVVVPVRVSAVSVQPSNYELAVGDSVRLEAEALDQFGNVIPGVCVHWTSSDTTVLRVNQQGWVKALKDGTARVEAYVTLCL